MNVSNNPGVTFQMSEIDTAILISGQPYQRLCGRADFGS